MSQIYCAKLDEKKTKTTKIFAQIQLNFAIEKKVYPMPYEHDMDEPTSKCVVDLRTSTSRKIFKCEH